MTIADPWAPAERDWKEFAEPAAAHDSRPFDHAILETDCPGCGRHVGALIIDGPDPVFVSLVCPLCSHGDDRDDGPEWVERVA